MSRGEAEWKAYRNRKRKVKAHRATLCIEVGHPLRALWEDGPTLEGNRSQPDGVPQHHTRHRQGCLVDGYFLAKRPRRHGGLTTWVNWKQCFVRQDGQEAQLTTPEPIFHFTRLVMKCMYCGKAQDTKQGVRRVPNNDNGEDARVWSSVVNNNNCGRVVVESCRRVSGQRETRGVHAAILQVGRQVLLSFSL